MKTFALVILAALGLVVGGQVAAQAGQRIVFHVCQPDRYWICSIVVADADGSNAVTIGEGRDPAWSPDGSRLAFARSGWGGCKSWETQLFDNMSLSCPMDDVLVLDVGTGQVINLTDHPAFYYSPLWSPDGSKIAFASDRDDRPYYYGWGDLYVMNADGSDVHRLTDLGFVEGIAWFPDSARLTFICYGDEALGYPPEVCQINADGTGLTHISGP